MSGFVYHGALAPLEEAVRKMQGDVQFVTGLLDDGGVKAPVLRKSVILLRHISFALRILFRRTARTYLVREFSNVPLWLVFPLIRHRSKQLFFLVNHNLQWTFGSKSERAAFIGLANKGCRFIFFEQVPSQPLKEYGINHSAFRHLSHPIPGTPVVRKKGGDVECIGIIGQYRREKGLEELLDQLKPLTERYRIVLAIPNVEEFKNESQLSGVDWITLIDTSDFDDYRTTIANCDVIIVNQPEEGYMYRASGLVADAAAAHVPVVARGLPVIGSQVNNPVCIGETFVNPSEIDGCIERVSERLRRGGYDFSRYEEARSVRELTSQLSDILAKV